MTTCWPPRSAIRCETSCSSPPAATFLRADKATGRGAILGSLAEAAGIVRTGGAGTRPTAFGRVCPELAWVAAGRVDAWAQPNVDPWDWLPGRLLVEEAGGVTAIVDGDPRRHLAGPRALVDELRRWAPGGAPSR